MNYIIYLYLGLLIDFKNLSNYSLKKNIVFFEQTKMIYKTNKVDSSCIRHAKNEPTANIYNSYKIIGDITNTDQKERSNYVWIPIQRRGCFHQS